jgi:hypothetical protein
VLTRSSACPRNDKHRSIPRLGHDNVARVAAWAASAANVAPAPWPLALADGDASALAMLHRIGAAAVLEQCATEADKQSVYEFLFAHTVAGLDVNGAQAPPQMPME